MRRWKEREKLLSDDILQARTIVLAAPGPIAACGSSLVVESGGYSLVAAYGLLIAVASVVELWALGVLQAFRSCSIQAW